MLMTIQECSPLIHYEPAALWEEGRASGNETYGDGFYIVSWHPSSTASFSFNGTWFSIVGVKGPDFGDFVVSVDGINYTGTANDPEFKYEEPLYESSGPLANEMHNVVFTIGEGNKPVKLDFIKWTSDIGLSNANDTDGNPHGNDDSNTMQHKNIQDTDKQFTYSPQEAWNMNPQMVQSFNNQSGHSTSLPDATVTFTFNGTAISLYGSIGPKQTSSYSVSLDSMEPVWYNATRTWWANNQVLYHASNLGPGEHTVVVTNGHQDTSAGDLSSDSVLEPSSGLIPRVWSRRSSRSRVAREEGSGVAALYDPGEHRRGRKREASPTDGQGILGSFDLDYARVWGANLEVVTSTSTTPTPTPTVSSQPTVSSTTARNLSTGAIAGISVAAVVFVLLLAALWFLNKRNKILWRRLQKGYMVQSQFDPSTPPGSRSPRQNMSTVNLLQSIPFRRGTGDVDPFPPGYEAATRPADADANGLYVPYAGFGHRHANSKSPYTHLEDSKELPAKEGYQTYDDVENVPLAPRINEPTRSDTLMTSSTLVAEDGTFATLDDITEDDEAPRKSAKRVNTLRRVGPPTNSTVTTPTTPTPSTTIPGIRHSNRSSRRRDKAYPNSQRSKASRHTHSSSPSRDQLLGPGNHFNSDSDLNDWEYEDDISEDWEDAHDFYASEASQGGIVAVTTPLSPGARSLGARTQSELEVQTPIGRRMFDFSSNHDTPVPELPLVRHRSSMAGTGNVESDVEGDSRVYLPKHQTTGDTVSTLPAYTSKRNSLK